MLSLFLLLVLVACVSDAMSDIFLQNTDCQSPRGSMNRVVRLEGHSESCGRARFEEHAIEVRT